MEADDAVLAALSDLRAAYPAMRVRLEHVAIEGPQTVFRATLALPGGAEATGYGGVAGTGPAAIAVAEQLALARALTFLGVDPDDLLGRGPDDELAEAGIEPDYGARSGLASRAVADESPSDPFDLGRTPSAAAVAAATGMRLGARDAVPRARESRPAETGSEPPARPEPARARPSSAPARDDGGAAGGDEDENEETGDAPDVAESREASAGDRAADPGAPPRSGRAQPDDDVAVSHQAFWRWARERGLERREDVEDLIGQPIGGLRPGQVRDLIMAAQDEQDGDAGK